jgi:hypothetical protein
MSKRSCPVVVADSSSHYVRGLSVICKKCRTTGGYDDKLEHKIYDLGTRGNRLNPEYMTKCNGSFTEAPDECESDTDGSEDSDSGSDSGSEDLSSISSDDASDEEVVKVLKKKGPKGPKGRKGPKGPKKSSASSSASVASKASKASKRTVDEMLDVDVGGGLECSPERKCRKVECPSAPKKPALGSKVATKDDTKATVSRMQALWAEIEKLQAQLVME